MKPIFDRVVGANGCLALPEPMVIIDIVIPADERGRQMNK
jgi:hypothetical protein